jgi:signal peptidase I
MEMQADVELANTPAIPATRTKAAPFVRGSWRFPSWVKQVTQCLLATAMAFASYYLISHYLVQSVQVVGSSMVPTLHDSEHYLLNRWVYHFRSPQRKDVVVLRDPSAACFSVKRVIGKEGDSVYLKDGFVFLNGRKLEEPYLSPGTPTFAMGHYEELLICGKDRFFLLGDNRMNSADSRVYGPVPRENIVGMLVR